MRPTLPLVVLILLPGLAGLASADAGHEGHDGATDGDDSGFSREPPPQGIDPSRGDRVRYYSYYQGAELYGASTVKVVGDQFIRDLATDGEWLVWIDAIRNDVYAYNIAAGDGFYVTDDTAFQRHPRVSNGVVVWDDARSGPSDVFAYFLDTGETRRLSRGGDAHTSHETPAIDGAWVAWQDDRGRDFAVYAYNLHTNQEVQASPDGQGRHTDPIVVGEYVVWRTYRFNVWDILWLNVETGESGSVTADREMEGAPFRGGDQVLFLKETDAGWLLHRWDPEARLTESTGIHVQTPTEPAASAEAVVTMAYDGPRATFVGWNLTTGYGNRVSGYLPIMDKPVMHARTLYVPVFNGTKASILSLAVSPFALMRPPVLIVETPEDGSVVRGTDVRVRGRLTFEDTYGPPDAFFASVNGANYTSIAPTPGWAFTLDTRNARAGVHVVSVEAHYREAPTVRATFDIVVPASFRGADIEEAGYAYHAARIMGYYERYVGSNPAVLVLLVLAALAVGLAVARHRLTVVARRRGVVEFVRPDE